mgnify:FL=1
MTLRSQRSIGMTVNRGGNVSFTAVTNHVTPVITVNPDFNDTVSFL